MSRLIDENALWMDVIHSLDYCDDVLEIIERQPTIEERKKGEWIKMSDSDGEYYCCNNCGEELPRYTTEMPTLDRPYPHKHSIDRTDYCPNCGADMRG